MSSPPRVDICIVNYFGAHDVRDALRVLGTWSQGRTFVVDNSADAAQSAALHALAGIELLEPGENLGFGRGCNMAFARSDADFFLLLNPDARMSATELAKLVQAMQSQPCLGALSPRIWWNDERSFLLPAAFPQTPFAALAQNLAPRFQSLTLSSATRYLARQRSMLRSAATTPVAFLAGAVLLLRRAAIEAAGGLFDADYFMFYEDSDLSLRLLRNGWQLGVSGGADAVHEYRHKAFKGALMSQARAIYFRKNFPLAPMRRIDALARPVPVADWFDVLPQACRTLEDFRAATANAAVHAFSPSTLMMPCIFRPSRALPFTAAEWNLLEPAIYTALLEGRRRWIQFERS